MNIIRTAIASIITVFVSTIAIAETIKVATVNNGDMIRMQGLTNEFTSKTGINVEWVTLEENVLRQKVTTDITTKGGQFDVLTIGTYEVPIWGGKGWLNELNFSASYDVDDLLPAIRSGLSIDGKLYAAPFYGESSMIMYRKDLVAKAGMTMPQRPTWGEVYDIAKAITEGNDGVYGACLRGKPGWGEGGAFITTVALSLIHI